MIKLSTIIKRDKAVIRVRYGKDEALDDKNELALRMALHARGLKWSAGQSFATYAIKDDSGFETLVGDCIYPKEGKFCSYKWYIGWRYKVYPFSQVILDK